MGVSRAQRRRADTPVRLVLGVDPGTVRTGWGVVAEGGSDLQHIASGVVRARGSRADRLGMIYQALRQLCEQFAPAVVSLEQSFVGPNVQTAFRLGEARGAVMIAAAGAGVPVIEYSPAEIKVAVAGSGRATKGQIETMVRRLLGVQTPLCADEADALGAAICHAHTSRFTSLVAGPSLRGGRRAAVGSRRLFSRR